MGKISVGASWFNTMFVPIVVLMSLVLAPGALANWKSDTASRLVRLPFGGLLWWQLLVAVAAPFIMGGALNCRVVLGVGISIWLIVATLLDVWHKSRRSPMPYL